GEIARGILALEIAPALEGGTRARLDQHQFAVEHQLAALDAVFAGGRAQGQNALAAGDLSADHPIKRAAGEVLGALGLHAGGVDVLGLLPAPLFLAQLLLDPVFQVGDRVAADAKLDEVEGHRRLPEPKRLTGARNSARGRAKKAAPAPTLLEPGRYRRFSRVPRRARLRIEHRT